MTNTSNKKKKKRGVSIKACIVMLAVVMLLGCAIGSTVAWLISTTDTVTNTFTYGDINIELKETTGTDYKIIPGIDIAKDPKVTVKAGSEKCYLFVKVDKTIEFINGVTCKLTLDSKPWEKGTGESGNGVPTDVYFRVVDPSEKDTVFELIDGNKITVSGDVTKAQIDKLSNKTGYISFTAYAVQYASFESNPAGAWAQAQASKNPTP